MKSKEFAEARRLFWHWQLPLVAVFMALASFLRVPDMKSPWAILGFGFVFIFVIITMGTMACIGVKICELGSCPRCHHYLMGLSGMRTLFWKIIFHKKIVCQHCHAEYE